MFDGSSKPVRLLKAYWPAALIGAMWLWMFGPMICGQTVSGFRDSAYLYYPLFKWIDSVWASGAIPLWNPYCNYGLPVVGDGSSSVFYPGKLIFLFRWLPYPSRYGIYLASHVPLAAIGTYRFARTMKANQAGATLAAISYAFGGSVLFQVNNVIYLVSAAWLPFALLFVWRGVLGGDVRASVWAGVVCALMILGGDPQMVYHVGLIAAISVVFRFWQRRRWLLRNSKASCHEAYGWLAKAGTRLVLMVIATSGLAAIQILPTAHWAERSERAASGEIHNLGQAMTHALSVSQPSFIPGNRIWRKGRSITDLDSTLIQAFFAKAAPRSQKNATYQFSQSPFSVAELFFPNVMGKPFPTHQRWSDALPGAERIWTPSIYAGVLTVLLAMSQFRLWGKRRRHVWLCRIGVFFAVASFGWFGAVWLLNEVRAGLGLSVLNIAGLEIGPQVGGLYWFMSAVLPKYFMFRYPAKLFVIASLMISVLAGLAVTNTSPKRQRVSNVRMSFFTPDSLAGASGLYCAALLSVACVASWVTLQIAPIESTLARIRPNLLFGPLDVTGTIAELNISFAQPLIVIAAVAALIFVLRKTGNRLSVYSTWVTIAVVLVTAVDICVANRWLLAEVDPAVFEAPTKITKQLDELKAKYPDTIPRIYRSFDVQSRYQTWPNESSPNRLEEIVTWQRETLFPKHHLEYNVALLGSFGSIWPATYGSLTDNLNLEFNEKGYLLVPIPMRYRLAGQMTAKRLLDSLHLLLYASTEQVFGKETELLRPLGGWNQSRAADAMSFIPFGVTEKAKVVSSALTMRQVIVEINTAHECRLNVHVLHDDGWQAATNNLNNSKFNDLKITPSRGGIGMNVDLQPGQHRVVFTYSPREFWIGYWVSSVSWLLLGTSILYWRRTQMNTNSC